MEKPKKEKLVSFKQKFHDIGKTVLGEPADIVVTDPEKATIDEQKESTAVFAFGRFNPPTVGHEKLINKVKDTAKDHEGSAHIFASHSEGKSDNPLPQSKKLGYLEKVAGSDAHVHGSSKEEPSFLHAAKKLHQQGHDHLVMVAGSDRVKGYEEKLNQYNGKEGHFNFKSIKVVSAGQRDPDAEGVEGMSGTKMRSLARSGNHAEFKAGLPKALHPHAKEIGDHIRGIPEEVSLFEALDMRQRLRRSISIKRNKSKITRARELARKRLAGGKQIRRRSLKRAKDMLRSRIAGQRGRDYSSLSTTDKIAVDRMLDKRQAQIKRIATRITPRVKRDEVRRLSAVASHKKMLNTKLPIVASYELTDKEEKYLMEKAEASQLPYNLLKTIFMRGKSAYANENPPNMSSSQFAFNRLASFINKGRSFKKDDKDVAEAVNKMKGEDPCWAGYEMVGMKKKNGKEVPNCVPKAKK